MRLRSQPVLLVATLVLAAYWNTGTAKADYFVGTQCKPEEKEKEETAPHKVEVKDGSGDFIEVKLGTLKCTKSRWNDDLFQWCTSSCTVGGVTWKNGEGHYFKEKRVYIDCYTRGAPVKVEELAGNECSADDIKEGTIEIDTPVDCGNFKPEKIAKMTLTCKDHAKKPKGKVWIPDSCEIDGVLFKGGEKRTTDSGTYTCYRLDQPEFRQAKVSTAKKDPPPAPKITRQDVDLFDYRTPAQKRSDKYAFTEARKKKYPN